MFTKPRRIGISWTEAADASLTAACSKSAGGMNVTYICYDKDITRQFIKDCAAWARAYNLVVSKIFESEVFLTKDEVFRRGDEEKSILVFRIYFDSGHEIEAIAGTPRKLRGRKGRIIVDEAAHLDEGILPLIIEAGLALQIWGGDLRMITSYNGIDNDYYRLELEVLAGRLPYSRHFTTFREAIADGLYRRICLSTGTEWSADGEVKYVEKIYANYADRASQELDCIPARSGGNYIPRAVIEQCMNEATPVLKLSLDSDFALWSEADRIAHVDDWLQDSVAPYLHRLEPEWRSYLGEDFGRSGDLTVLMPLQLADNLVRVCPFALELRNVPFEQQKQVLVWLCDRLPRFMFGAFDAGGNGGFLAEAAMLKYGTGRIAQLHLSAKFYGEWFPKYKAALEDRKITIPQSADWLQDHRDIQMIGGIPRVKDGRSKGNDGGQRHGDSAIACCLAWYASLQEGAPIEFLSAGKRVGAGGYGGDSGMRGY